MSEHPADEGGGSSSAPTSAAPPDDQSTPAQAAGGRLIYGLVVGIGVGMLVVAIVAWFIVFQP